MERGGLEQLSDGELLAVVQGDDVIAAERAFEVMYFRHRDLVYRVARRFAGDDELAMDAAQEVFAYLLKKLPRLRLTGKLSTYLYPIAKNCGISQRRKLRRRMPGVEAFLDAHGEFPIEDPADFRVEGEAVNLIKPLAMLPEAQREVLLMRVVDGMSVEEVARALGIPEGTVKSRLFHAIGALRENGELRGLWEGMG